MTHFLRLAVTSGIVLLVSGSAQAQNDYSMTGQAIGQNTLAWVLPMSGDIPCPPSFIFGTGMQFTTPAPTTTTMLNTRQFGANGCIPGNANITTPGTFSIEADMVGGKFTVPYDFFSQMVPGMTRALPMPSLSTIPQVASSWSWRGPPTSVVRTQNPVGSMNNGTNTAPFRVFQAGAWMNQTGRNHLDFTWCPDGPGMGITQCGAPAAGNRPLLVKNIGGSNPAGGYGGTMNLMFFTTGVNPSSFAQARPLMGLFGPMTIAIGPIEPCDGAHTRCTKTRMTTGFGRGYAISVTQYAVIGDVYQSYALTTNTVPSMALISMLSGVAVGTGPAAYQTSQNFPLTTGTVIVRQTGMTNQAMINVITITGMGGDSTTPMGMRNLQLVAGKVATAVIGTAFTFDYTAVAYRRFQIMPEPGGLATAGAGLFGLLGIAAWRARAARGND